MKRLAKHLGALMFFVLITIVAVAQGPGGHPGGHPGGYPGGRPQGGYPGHPGEGFNGPRGDMRNDPRSESIKQKKVHSGSTFRVTGTLRDSVNKEPLMFVNVAILDGQDSSFIKGGTTDEKGFFDISEIPSGKMLLRASCIGYQNLFLPFNVENNTALGTIKLKPGSTTMKEVKITAERPLYAQDGEKMIYNVADDPSIQTGTTSDALQNAPGVEVDIEGNISLRGVSSVEIWVNDKPSKLTEENLKTHLETLPANALARIETITNPSAKYATESEAVINIITSAHIKKNHFISFGANAASQPNVSPWVSYTWANEKLTINAHINGRFGNRNSIGNGWSVTRVDNPLYPGDINQLDTIMLTQNSSESVSKNWGTHFGVRVDYEIDSSANVSIYTDGNINGRPSHSSSWNLRDQRFSGGNLYDYTTANNSWGASGFGMYGGDYSKKFDNKGHNLRLSLFGNFNLNNAFSNYDRIYSDSSFTDAFNQTYFKYYDNQWRSSNERISARYNRPYSQDGEMSYGFNYDRDDSHRDYRPYLLDSSYTDYTAGTIFADQLLDTLRRYTFEEHSQELSADAEWTHRWGGLTVELGLGAAYTNDHFIYGNSIAGNNDDTTYNFLTFNPSIHLSYRTKDMHNFKLNYSLRMRNPSEENLTTYVRYSEDSWSTGNRNLHASYTHNAEAGWTKFFNRFGYVGIEGYGRLSTGQIDNLTDVTDSPDPILGRIVNYTMPYNVGTSYRYGASANITYRPSGFFNLRLYANLYDYGYSMMYDKIGTTYSDHKVSWSIRMNAWAKVWNKYQIYASANYSSPTIGLMSQSSARYFVNTGVRADFFKRKMSVFVNVQDIFNWGYKIGSGSSNTNPYYLSSNTSRQTNSRYISAGLTFRFGKMELEKNSSGGAATDTSEE